MMNRINSIFRRNLPAKIVALGVAVVLWVVVMSDQNPAIEGSFTVPVAVVNSPEGYKVTKKRTIVEAGANGEQKPARIEICEEELAPDVTACIFWLKTRAGWRETQNVEQTFSRYYQALFLAGAEDAAGDVNYEIIREKSDDEIVNYCTLDGRKLTVDADAPGGTYTKEPPDHTAP